MGIGDIGDNPWAEGLVGWLAFGTEPLLVGVLVGTVADVIATGVAEDMAKGVGFGNLHAILADDHDKLGFVVDGVVVMGEDDGCPCWADGAWWHHEGDGCLWHDTGGIDMGKFIDMGGIVETNGIDVAWLHWGEEGAISEGENGMGEVVGACGVEDVAFDELGLGVLFDDIGIVELLVVGDACDFHRNAPFGKFDVFIIAFLGAWDNFFCGWGGG